MNIDSCSQAQIKLGQSIYQTLNRENDPCRPGSVTHCKEKCRWPTTRFSKKPNWDHGEHGVFVMIGKRTIIGGDFHEVENDHGERQHHLQAALCMWVDWSHHHDLGPMESMPIRASLLYIKRHQKNTQAKVFEKIALWQYALPVTQVPSSFPPFLQ